MPVIDVRQQSPGGERPQRPAARCLRGVDISTRTVSEDKVGDGREEACPDCWDLGELQAMPMSYDALASTAL